MRKDDDKINYNKITKSQEGTDTIFFFLQLCHHNISEQLRKAFGNFTENIISILDGLSACQL